MSDIIIIFTTIGFLTSIAALTIVTIIFIGEIKNIINHYKRKYQQKHRFDKPPTAKCYCIDCKYRMINNECTNFSRYTRVADDWFCWRAEPKD